MQKKDHISLFGIAVTERESDCSYRERLQLERETSDRNGNDDARVSTKPRSEARDASGGSMGCDGATVESE